MSRWSDMVPHRLPEKVKGQKNKGVARQLKQFKRDEAIERQQVNIDRGYYICDWTPGIVATIDQVLKHNKNVTWDEAPAGHHKHRPAPLKRQVRNKHNQLVTVSVF